MSRYEELTVVIPAKNEEAGLPPILGELAEVGCRVVVVDDGSTDSTAIIAKNAGALVISHKDSKGNGAAVKSGIRAVTTDYVALMDGDGQHNVEDTLKLFDLIIKHDGDLVVGARTKSGHASFFKRIANAFYNNFASFMVNKSVKDLTSGQRIFRTDKIQKILWILPNTFSYPTTSTMAFYRLGYNVLFETVDVKKANRKSHIRIFRDGFRFLLIIMKIGTLFSPFKLFVPISVILFFLGLGRYIYTYIQFGTFTNMSALLLVSSVIVFLMGVLSEQVSMVVYSRMESLRVDD